MTQKVKSVLDPSLLIRGLIQDLIVATGRKVDKDTRVASSAEQLKAVLTAAADASTEGMQALAARYGGRVDERMRLLAARSARWNEGLVRERPDTRTAAGKAVLAGKVVDAGTGLGLPNIPVRASFPGSGGSVAVAVTLTTASRLLRISGSETFTT